MAVQRSVSAAGVVLLACALPITATRGSSTSRSTISLKGSQGNDLCGNLISGSDIYAAIFIK